MTDPQSDHGVNSTEATAMLDAWFAARGRSMVGSLAES